ncbi:MAG: LPXTG cell wall anchor domain-containing protein [Propionibacteriales bacterium]|nr:LPXTG cell wall anchor domain-containing protein [Propionibacteriales bacterium]
MAGTVTALLVFSSGVVQADDVAPDPAPVETVTEAAPPPEEPTPPVDETQDPAPEAEAPSAPTDPAALSEGEQNAVAPSTDGAVEGASTGPVAAPGPSLSKITASPAAAALAVACTGGPGVPVGGFEIDGNTCAQAPVNKDWSNTGSSVEDGFDDVTGFTQGASENDPPTSWTVGGSPNGKSDIGTAWAYSQVSGGQVYGFFGLTNDSTSGGTSQFDLEYNQLNPVVNGGGYAVPNRSPGDLLFRFSSTGSDPIVFTDAKKYTLVSSPAWSNGSCFSTTANNTAGWCTIPIPPAAFAQQTNADGTFFEGAINISLFFGNGTCSGTFGTTSIRSVTGNAFATSALEDYVTPLGVNTPSTCGKIVINKQDLAGKSVGGATFSVSPNPDPTLANGTPYSITDNDSKDKDPANGVIEISPVDPNESYTVTETSPPPGYLLPAQTSQGPTLVGPSQTVTFTFNDPKQFQALTATKTANPTYTAQYAWSIVKEVSPNGQDGWVDDAITKNVPANGNLTLASLFYRVKVTEGARTTTNYKVSGNISVTNPNTSAVTADISDSLPGATCLVAGSATHTVAVPASSTVPYAYVCSFAGVPTLAQLTGTNTASVSWDKSDYPQVQGDVNAAGSYSISPTAGYAFGAETTSIDKTVTVTDSHHVFNPALTYTWSDQGDVNTSDVYTIDFSAVPGGCSATVVNTATLTGATTGVLDTDTASGKICAAQDLSITRMDVRGFKRTFPWAIQKTTTTPKLVVNGGAATADYEVTVTAGDGTDSDWAMSGTITANNPNTFESVSVTSVPVTYTGGGTCAVTGEVFPVVIPASGSHGFTYSCSFGGIQPSYSGTVNATVNWDQAAASTPNGSVSDGLGVTEANWTQTLVNATVTVHDDHAAGEDNVIATLDWDDVHAMPNHQQVLKYSVDLQDLPVGGTCGTKVNTAWIVGDGETQLDADQNAGNNSATVQVCNPLGLSIVDGAVGDYTRTYTWGIDKFIDTDQKSQQVSTNSADHTFSYQVVANPLARVDSAWTVTGSITIDNDNTDAAIDPITVTGVAELLGGVDESCVYDTAVPFVLASDENATVNFTCTTATPPTNDGAEPSVYSGTHAADVTWGLVGMATTTPAALSWNAPVEVDKSIAVYDNKVNNAANPAKLGDALWNAAGTPVVFGYDLNLSVPEETAGGCAPPFDNLAWLGGDGTTPTDLQSAAQAIICVNAVEPPVVTPPDPEPPVPGSTDLPDTGGPDRLLLLAGVVLLGAGGVLVLTTRRRERRH